MHFKALPLFLLIQVAIIVVLHKTCTVMKIITLINIL